MRSPRQAGRALGETAKLLIGAVAGLAGLLLAGELALRIAPPDDLRPFLGNESGIRGPYVSDPVLGADYRSFAAFAQDYAERLQQLSDENAGRPIWAMFGNSFVQAPGMLGDTAQLAVPRRQIFFLRRNEPIQLRVAQFRLLLEHGLRPQRSFFILLPNDLVAIALGPIREIAVTPEGGLARTFRKPAPLAPLLETSWLALAAWTRGGWNRQLPDYRPEDILEAQPPLVLEELDTLFGTIAAAAGRHGVPVTLVFIPNREQINGDPSQTPQQAIGAAAAHAGLDLLDTSPVFLAEADKTGLLIADGHLSDRGNTLLLSAILAYLGEAAGEASP